MIALADLGLFVIDPAAWNADRKTYDLPIGALGLHDRFLRRYPVRLLWSEDFFNGFPWNQPKCPPALFDVCVAVTSLHDYLKGNGRLVTPNARRPAPGVAPILEPDLLAEEEHPDDLRTAWLGLLGSVTTDEGVWADGVAVPTWERPQLTGVRDMRITLGVTPTIVRTAAVLTSEIDWQAFLERFHRPDLRGRRVAVLGGHRPPFERARQKLEGYGLTDLRRIPPVSEKNRTKQELKQSLQSADFLVVCTSYMGHTDTDQLKSIKDELSCAIVLLDADSDAQITKAVVDHFRTAAGPVNQSPAPGAPEGSA